MKYTTRGFRFDMWEDGNDINISITCDRGGGGQITVDSSCRVPLMRALHEAGLHLAVVSLDESDTPCLTGETDVEDR